jgi:Domain of unknown function (DUF5658)
MPRHPVACDRRGRVCRGDPRRRLGPRIAFARDAPVRGCPSGGLIAKSRSRPGGAKAGTERSPFTDCWWFKFSLALQQVDVGPEMTFRHCAYRDAVHWLLARKRGREGKGGHPGRPGAAATGLPRRRKPHGRVFWLLLSLFAALQVADVATTNLVLTIPGAREANPIMAAAQSHLGSLWWLPKAAIVAWFALVATQSRRRWPMVCAVSLCAVVVALNLANLLAVGSV